jgi:hypothetical protein
MRLHSGAAALSKPPNNGAEQGEVVCVHTWMGERVGSPTHHAAAAWCVQASGGCGGRGREVVWAIREASEHPAARFTARGQSSKPRTAVEQ